MKEKLETIVALIELEELAKIMMRKQNPGSDEYIKWDGRLEIIQKKLESAWKAVK
jgi:hypothetical protein